MTTDRAPGPVRRNPTRVTVTRRPAARVVGALLMLWVTLIAVAGPAAAGVGFGVVPTFPTSVVVGQTGLPASLSIQNTSTPPENAGTVTLTSITLVPSCGTGAAAIDCPAPSVDPGVFALSPTGVGEAGTVCAGTTFTIALVDATQGKYAFTPTTPVVLGPPGSPTDTCRIDFTINVVKAPTKDASAAPGLQTAQLAAAAGTSSVTGFTGTGSGTSGVTVAPASPAITTTASGPVAVGGAIHDTATLSGGAGPTGPTGTITFNLFGPNDVTCGGVPVFTSTVPVAGNGTYSSANFTTTAAGTYRFTASYSGDANNNPAGPTACTDPGEAVVVSPATPAITTTASAPVAIGGTIHDTATLTGGFSPTGTITFNLFGPNDATCAGPAVFTSTVPVAGNGSYDSGTFTVTAGGTYRFVASYSGDANNAAAGPTACTDPAETVNIKANPTITTTASAPVTVGGQIHDTATITGGLNPTGTV
ncbi:MAG: hypothetical protein ABR511_13105, partial [Acidimicrobiales bacterium]